MFFTSFRNWLKRQSQPAKTRTIRLRRAARPRLQLFLEPLEDRTLLSWTQLGPAPLGFNYLATENFSGRITGIAADPANANIVYIAAAGGGIWKTTDAQDAKPIWTPLTDNIPGTTDSMGAIALAPSNSSIIYAGTGEANTSGDSNYGEGILVSTDAGSTWTLENPGGIFTGLTVSKIAIDPKNANIAYAAIGNVGENKAYIPGTGLFKTTDGGKTWTDTTQSITTNDAFTDVVIDPSTGGSTATLYAAVGQPFGDTPNGIYKSTNAGSTWKLLSNFPNGSGDGRISLAISASNPSVLYAVAAVPDGSATGSGSLLALEESTDGGSTWTNRTNTPNFPDTQGSYDLSIAVDPTNSAIVYASGAAGPAFNEPAAIIRSTDSGVSWTDLDLTNGSVTPHADHHAIAFNANGKLLDGDDGGIFRLDSVSPVQWSDLNGNLSINQLESISINPSNGNVLAGGQDCGTDLYAGKALWAETDGGDGGQVFVSGTLAYHIAPVGSFGADFFRVSNDGGLTWTTATTGLNDKDPMNFYAPFAVDPSNPDRVVFGSNQIYQTTNAAGTWTQLTTTNSKGWNPSGNNVDAIGLAASDSKTIYASTGGEFASSSQIFVSTDGGATWTERDLPGGNGRVNQILVDPNSSTTAYAVISTFGGGHVFKTTNGGKTWTDISGNLPNLPTWTIQFDAANNILYVGNDEGVFSSLNGGATWSPFGTGLPNAQVFALDYVPSLNILAAGTHGRGAWEIPAGAPVVTSNPANQTVIAGQTATFTATANGTPTPTVQWKISTDGGKTFNNISGATSTTLTLNNVPLSLNGDEYEAVFTNAAGTVTTTAATLTVEAPPAVTTNPASQTVMAGQTVTFTAVASGNPTPTVQWQISTDGGKTFTNISGAVAATLTLNNVPVSLNGDEYQAVFTNKFGTATTTAATLTVEAAPAVTINPANQTVVTGQMATFTAAASGNPTPTVQWQISTDGGKTFSNISGATSTTLTIPNVQLLQSGYEYQAVFTNKFGTATTTAATLIIAQAPTVTSNPANQTVIAGQTATFTAAANGTPTPTVQWQVSTDGGKTFTNITGATSTTLTLNNVQSSQNGDEYAVVFTNLAGIATTSAATLTVQTVPTVTSNPASQTVIAGQTATFTAASNGNPTPTMQWQVSTDGGKTFIDISGATSPTLTLTNVLFAQNGYEYQAVFTNAAGTVTTSAATLTVEAPPTVTSNPANQTVIAGQTATFTAAASGNPTPTVQWQVSTDGGKTFIDISGATSPTLTLTNAQFSQNGNEYQAVFTNAIGSATTTAATLTVQTVPAVTTNPLSQTVTAGQMATFTASASGNPTPTVQWQISTDGGKTFTNINGATSTTLTLPKVPFSLNGDEYQAVFTNIVGTVTTSAATLTVQTVPTVTSNPASQTVIAGQTATFTASASGSPTPTMQWQVSTDGGNTFSNISGATAATLTLNNVQFAQNGYEYQAVFTNAAGIATTSAATLTVQTVPSVTANPADQAVIAGQTATFTASASGNPTPTVQWQVSTDGGKTFSNISGATSTTLTLNNVQFSLNGDEYQAVFTNIVGTVTTSAATLTVTPAAVNATAGNTLAVFNTQAQTVTLNASVADPSNANNVVGEGTVTFTIKSGSGTVGSVKGTVSGGKASASFTLPAGLPAGSYTVAVLYSDSQGNFSDNGDTSGTLTVSPATATTTASNASAIFSPNAQTVTLNAAIADASYPSETVGEGTVTFTIKSDSGTVGSVQGTVSGGKASASFTLPAGLPVGSYTVAVLYSDSQGNFSDNGDTNGTLIVTPAKVSTTASNTSAMFNTQAQTVTLNAAVADTSNANDVVGEGTVTFTIENGSSILGSVQGTVNNGKASASFALPAGLPVGSYAVVVRYSDSQSNISDSSDTNGILTIGVAATTTQLTQVSLAPNLLTQTVTETLTAHVNSSTTVNQGTVTFTVSNQTLRASVDANGNATASLILPAQLTSFPQVISVRYVDPASNLTVSTDAETAPWQSVNAMLPSAIEFNALQRTVTADILGFHFTETYNAAGLLTEIDFGSLQLVFHYNAFNQLTGVTLDGITL